MADQQPPPLGPSAGSGGPGDPAQWPPPERKGGTNKGMLIGLGVVAVLVVIAIVAAVVAASDDDDDDGDTATEDVIDDDAGEIDDDIDDIEGDADEIDDVELDTCRNDPAVDWAAASGTVENDWPEASTYVIDLDIVDADGTVVGSASSSVENVPPDADATWEALASVPLPEGGSCVVTSVDRTPA